MGNIERQNVDVKVPGMQVLTGRVVAGKIDLGDEVPDGSVVAILVPNRERRPLTAADEAELSEALEEIRRGAFEDGHALLAEIKSQAQR